MVADLILELKINEINWKHSESNGEFLPIYAAFVKFMYYNRA